jgi:hypothetical protein
MKRKLLRYLIFWLYTLFALGIPCILVVERYGLFKDAGARQWGFGLIVVLILCLFYFRKHVSLAIENMPSCTFKYICVGIRELSPLIIMYVAFLFVKLSMDNITFIMLWSCISNAFALLFRTFHLKLVDEQKIKQ